MRFFRITDHARVLQERLVESCRRIHLTYDERWLLFVRGNNESLGNCGWAAGVACKIRKVGRVVYDQRFDIAPCHFRFHRGQSGHIFASRKVAVLC